MQVRDFWLINNNGDKYELLNKNHFLYLPTGLGFNRTYSYQRFGNTEKIDTTQFTMLDVVGEMLFKDTTDALTYQQYRTFLNFIKYKPLQLHYLPPNEVNSYFADILITQLDKSEINSSDGLLHCAIQFHRTSQWQNSVLRSYTFINQDLGDGKYYDLSQPYSYSTPSLSYMEITNDGFDEVGFIWEVDCREDSSQVINPQLTLYADGSNTPYGIIKLIGTFDYVKVNSKDIEQSIYLENDGSALANPTSYQDLSIDSGQDYLTFIPLKVGKTNAVFSCSALDTFTGKVKFNYYESCASV